MKRILIMAGGTGGHVFPGIAVGKYMREKGIDVQWLGTENGFEAKIIPEAGFPLHFISIAGVRGKGIKRLLFAPFQLFFAVMQSFFIIRRLKPDVVLGMGGFASGPGGLAAWVLRCPLIIHEQNAKAGLTNQWLSHIATKILEGFPNTFAKKNSAVVGNPVRKEIVAIENPEIRFQTRTHPLRLLVVGGSLGAQAINELLPEVLSKWPEENRPDVYHQTGEKTFQSAADLYKKYNITARVVPFINKMDEAYAWADVVLCRAGASTIAELCAVGLGAILVPYPHAVDDHQTANASFMVKAGAAYLIQQNELTADKLMQLLNEFILMREKYFKMAQAAYQLRQVEATEKVFTFCKEACH